MKRKVTLLLLLFCMLTLHAQEVYKTVKDLPYIAKSETDAYRKERCKLDVYYPVDKKDFPTIVWFHGGGLEGGGKHIPQELMNRGFAVVAVNYRLSPKAKNPAYIEDAAAAVAWTFNNISKYGGDTTAIYVAGHSAGGYLTSMIGLDKSYLEKYGIDADRIAGLIPFSGQAITHFETRRQQGLDALQPTIDKSAPLYHVRKDCAPMLIISGDRELELYGRYEEQAYFWRMLKLVGHPDVTLYELDGYDHGGMAQPGFPLLLKFVADHERIRR